MHSWAGSLLSHIKDTRNVPHATRKKTPNIKKCKIQGDTVRAEESNVFFSREVIVLISQRMYRIAQNVALERKYSCNCSVFI